MYALIGIKPMNEEEEREAILTALDNNHNFETYIYDNLEHIDSLFIMEKSFWDNWCQNVAFNENKSFAVKKE
jgi:hypothetical protein